MQSHRELRRCFVDIAYHSVDQSATYWRLLACLVDMRVRIIRTTIATIEHPFEQGIWRMTSRISLREFQPFWAFAGILRVARKRLDGINCPAFDGANRSPQAVSTARADLRDGAFTQRNAGFPDNQESLTPPEDQVGKHAEGEDSRQDQDDDEGGALPGGIDHAGQRAPDAICRLSDDRHGRQLQAR